MPYPKTDSEDAGGGTSVHVVGGVLPMLVVAALGTVVVLALRMAGVVVGPVALVVGALAILLFPGPRRLADRLLATAAVVVGWFPLLGWIPGIGTRVDVPGILLALAVGVVAGDRFRRRRDGRPRARATVATVDLLALVVAQAATAWWALPLARYDLVHRLGLLVTAWDHSAHLHFLRSNLHLGSFITSRPVAASGERFFGADYPQGIHQAWAQWARLWDPTPALDPRTMLHLYAVMVVVTTGIAVAIACLGIVRLFRRDATAAFAPMMAVVQVGAIGLLSIAVWWGFPNFGIAVAAVATAPALLLRPWRGPRLTFLVVSGLVLVGAYNWYPIAVIGAAPLVVAAVRLWRQASRPWERPAAFLACSVTTVAVAAPVYMTLHLGTDLALARGGIPAVPRWLVLASTAALSAAAVLRRATTGERAVSAAVCSLGLVGIMAVVAVVAYQVASEGQVMYYGEKLATGVAAACLIALTLLVAEWVARHRRSSTAVAVLASIAVLQLTGYVGPQWRRLAAEQAASGFRAHEEWMTSPRRKGEELVRMLATAEALQVERAAPGADARWCYIDIDRAEPMPTLADTWVAALVGDLDVARVRLAAALDPLHQPHVVSPHIAADVLTTIYPTIARADLRLVVSHALGTELVGRGAPWRTPGLLWVLSGRELAPLVPE